MLKCARLHLLIRPIGFRHGGQQLKARFVWNCVHYLASPGFTSVNL